MLTSIRERNRIMSRDSLLSLLEDFARSFQDLAIVEQRGYRRETRTYKELMGMAMALALHLKMQGVHGRDRVLLWAPNSFKWAAAFWGCLMRGAVVVPLDDSSTAEFAARVASDADVKFAFVSRNKRPLLHTIPCFCLEDFPPTSAPKSAPRAGAAIDPARVHVKFEVSSCPIADEPITRDTVAEILFTSGTTSEPRGVVLTHGNFLANLEPLEKGIDPYRKYERWLHPLRFVSVVPLSHVFGQFMGLFVPPLLGATVVFENSRLPTEILRTVRRERATLLVAVPRMLDSVRNALEREIDSKGRRKWFTAAGAAARRDTFLRRVWRFRRLHARLGWKFWAFISGGAALSPETEEFFKRIGYAVVQGYGMTETASLISLNHPFHATEGSVGKVLPGREFRLAEDGEILVRGENVASGYWEKGALRPTGEGNGGWLRTGDLGELDSEGNLRFRGRKKSVIVTPAGLNVYPEDLEAALRKQSVVRDVVVIPLALNGNAEPCAVLLMSSSDPAVGDKLAQTAVDAANRSLAEYQRIRRWVLWPDPDLPRTPTGKPRLAAISSRAAELLDAQSPKEAGGIPSRLAQAGDARDLLFSSAPENLKDLSSLDRVELLSDLEHRYNVELNETQFSNAQSRAEIVRMLTEPTARRSDYTYPRWTQGAPAHLLRLLVYYALTWPATVLLAHPRVRGRDNLAQLKGPAIFIANHTTRRADIGLVLFALPARFRHHLATAIGGETLQNFRHPPREWFFAKRWLWQLAYFMLVSLFNVFPLPQLSGFRESFRFAGESVDRGYSLMVFPEGVINDRDSPDMVRFQPGIGLLAQNLRIPIVPMRLDGVWQMKREHRRLARLGELTVHVGAPVTFPPDTPPAEIASRLRDLVQSL
jgi:long-chain acyl-CoA synthetase